MDGGDFGFKFSSLTSAGRSPITDQAFLSQSNFRAASAMGRSWNHGGDRRLARDCCLEAAVGAIRGAIRDQVWSLGEIAVLLRF